MRNLSIAGLTGIDAGPCRQVLADGACRTWRPRLAPAVRRGPLRAAGTGRRPPHARRRLILRRAAAGAEHPMIARTRLARAGLARRRLSDLLAVPESAHSDAALADPPPPLCADPAAPAPAPPAQPPADPAAQPAPPRAASAGHLAPAADHLPRRGQLRRGRRPRGRRQGQVRPRSHRGRLRGPRGRQAAEGRRLLAGQHPGRAAGPAALRQGADRARRRRQPHAATTAGSTCCCSTTSRPTRCAASAPRRPRAPSCSATSAPTTLAAVVYTSGRSDAAQEFTNSQAWLLAAIDKFMGRKIRSATLGPARDEQYRPARPASRANAIHDILDPERG